MSGDDLYAAYLEEVNMEDVESFFRNLNSDIMCSEVTTTEDESTNLCTEMPMELDDEVPNASSTQESDWVINEDIYGDLFPETKVST